MTNPSVPSRARREVRDPTTRLVTGLAVMLAIILAFCLYTVREVRELRDEQTTISERNRLDSLQLLRIQNNLSVLATAMRDMADRTEPYPMVSWRQTFDRIKADLHQAILAERALAPAVRPPAQQQRLLASVDRFWETIDHVFDAAAANREQAAEGLLRTDATSQHQELVSMVSQFLVLNNRVQEEATQLNQAIYGRVMREILVLMTVLLLLVTVTGGFAIAANRRAFADVRRLSGELRNLSWRMLRMQEDLQEAFSRELHDEFGQLLTAIGMLLGRVKRQLPDHSPLVADLEEVRGIVQQTLERIRTESRMLHPVILDDFGLEKALEWYVGQFGRQHGIDARFVKDTPIGIISPEATIHIYRIVQEALTNVSRHSGSPEATVHLSQQDNMVTLQIEDRGRGLPADAERREGWQGIGLISMRERAELMGGTFAWQRAAPKGLRITVRVPLGGRVARPGREDADEALEAVSRQGEVQGS